MENEINIQTFRELFVYLKNAVIFLPEKYKQQVFQNMCATLKDWNGATPEVLRTLMNDFGYLLEEKCEESSEKPAAVEEERDKYECECGNAIAAGPYCRPCYHRYYG
jgi:hypothetical protein